MSAMSAEPIPSAPGIHLSYIDYMFHGMDRGLAAAYRAPTPGLPADVGSAVRPKEEAMGSLRLFVGLLVGAVSALGAVCATAQEYPSKLITFVLPFPPGGVTDPVARLVAQKMSESVKQQFIVENKPGASGMIAAEAVKRTPPDGYTVLMGFTGSHAVNPSLYAKLPYDPIKDFQPVTLLISTKHVLVVPAESPAKSVAELVALAKKTPGGLTFASQSIGAGGHLLGEMLKVQAKVPLTHVAYKGSAPALQDLLAGRVDLFFDAVVTSLPHIKAGKLRALAVADKTRSSVLPDVPTMAEAGFPGVEMDQWFGMLVPAGTPPPIVKKLHEELVKAVRHPEVASKITSQGLDVVTTTPEEFASLIKQDSATLGKVVKDAGIRAE
jgi:tripartite-type tricarboxylate transporter receptor subunit TctC